MDFYDFGHFLDTFRGPFWDQSVKKWDAEKGSKKDAENSTRGDPANSDYRPCGPLKETKDPPILRDFAPRGSLKAVPGKATQFSH